MGDAPRKNGPRSQGGQAAAPSLFGLPGNGSAFRRSPSTRTATQKQADDAPRKVGGLSFGQRRSRLPDRVAIAAPSYAVASQPVLSMHELMAKYRRTPDRPQDDHVPEPEPTSAMLETAAAADLREAFPAYHHDDEETRHSLPILCGHADIALAIEG